MTYLILINLIALPSKILLRLLKDDDGQHQRGIGNPTFSKHEFRDLDIDTTVWPAIEQRNSDKNRIHT